MAESRLRKSRYTVYAFLSVFIAVFLITLIAGCSAGKTVTAPSIGTENISKTQVCPVNCDDSNACTKDVCNQQTDYECRHAPITPCCGNSVCESGETEQSCPSDCKQQLSKEIQDTIANSNKIKSYKYDFSNSTLSLVFTIKGSLTKINYLEPQYYGNFQYDAALLDDSKKTAKIYCEKYCTPNGVMDWSYEFFKKETPLEAIKTIKGAKILRYENLEGDKSTTLLEIAGDDGKEMMWVWTFYGVPIYREFYDAKNQKTGYVRYQSMRVNSVSDSEFNLPG